MNLNYQGEPKKMKSILAVIITLILCTNAAARVEDKRWIRQETTYVVEEILIEKEELPELFSTMTILKIIPGIDLSEFTDLDVLYQPYIIEPEEDEYRGETLHEIVEKIAHKNMRDIDKWFLKEEVKFLNRNEIYGDLTFDPNVELRVPKYSPLLHRGKCCSDMRNMMVAVMKGEQYNVHWAYMIGVRTHENPEKERDHFAYGVVTKPYTAGERN